MSQSPQGAAFLEARAKFVRCFGITVNGKKQILAQLALYDDLLYEAYRPHVINDVATVIKGVMQEHATPAHAAKLTHTNGEPITPELAQHEAMLDVLKAIGEILKPAPKADAA